MKNRVKVGELASVLGVQKSVVKSWLKGDSLPDIDQAELISEAFNFPLRYLFGSNLQSVPKNQPEYLETFASDLARQSRKNINYFKERRRK